MQAFSFRFSAFVPVETIILLCSLVINSGTVSAAGFAVSPSSLEFTVEKDSHAQKQLRIYNSGEEGAEFAAQSSNKDVVKVSPEKGFVEGEGPAVVTVTATGVRMDSTSEEVLISFSSRNSNANREVSLELGTAVPVKITAVKSAEAAANVVIGSFLSVSIVMVGLAIYYSRRKRTVRLAGDFQSAYDLYMARR